MDITLLFKACIKTVRTTNKALGAQDVKTDILKTRNVDPNLKIARGIVKQIKNLEEFLRENKAAYLNVINYVSTYKTMNEADREKLDSTAEEIINRSKASINKLRDEIKKEYITNQKFEHYSNIISLLEKYLKDVSKMYVEAKAVRVKRVVEAHKISRLELKPSQSIAKSEPTSHSNESLDVQSKSDFRNIVPTSGIPGGIEDNQLTVEEMQMFESENELLFNELNSLSDEVRQMESKVVHIAELQELFTEKVLQQEKDIDRIATTVASATDNMRDANDQIRQAIQRNAGLRVWLLFFLLVMSFSLLFLDWYND